MLYHRERGNPDGAPLLILHGGWGYDFYPADAQIEELGRDHRILIPDRTGYARSGPMTALEPGFHRRYAEEMFEFLDGAGAPRAKLWGHSDGAVIALIMALARPDDVRAIVVEAVHLDRKKPRSRAFFTAMRDDPDTFGPRVTQKLAADLGDPTWRTVLHAGGTAWLQIAATPDEDFYDHRLGDLRVPALVLHGADDPRTEPGELDRIRREAPGARIHLIEGGGHSPHSERASKAECTAVGAEFLRAC